MSPSLSDFLGYSSIACWLGAQFPQILKNIQLKSCAGIALPFLCNWFLGDASNLIGCLMTHQLPLPVLCGQYFYYEGFKPSPPPFGRPRMGSIPSDRHYRTLDDHAGRPRISVDRVSGTDEDDSAFMADSFHSEGGQIPTRKRVSWSTERYGKRGGSVGRAPLSRSAFLPRLTPADASEVAVDRGRSLQRDADAEGEASAAELSPHPTDPNRRSSRASRRGANLVFLSLFALFGLGTWTSGALPGRGTSVGRVLTGVEDPRFVPRFEDYIFRRADEVPPHEPPHHDPIPTDPSNERVLGRIFAWLCTTLYLTSRLPQIWKNIVRPEIRRRAVDVPVHLCVPRNTFYVASILTSDKVFLPPPASTEFLRESLPYLLGSGGTLMFDVTIVSQSLIYRRPRRHGRSRFTEEEGGLLAGAS
ncbi:PQ loop repeat-domain-containing protein [Mycena filopes]|nr:PQ loop repeat-domain-containing protein [Mycena filopes]